MIKVVSSDEMYICVTNIWSNCEEKCVNYVSVAEVNLKFEGSFNKQNFQPTGQEFPKLKLPCRASEQPTENLSQPD